MHCKALFVLFLWHCGVLASSPTRVLDERQPSSTCTTSTLKPTPKGLHCGETGKLKTPHVLASSSVATEAACRDQCLGSAICQSISYDAKSKKCLLYGDHINDKTFIQGSGAAFFDRFCFSVACHCPPGLTDCFGQCVKLSSDPNNCGKCGIHCPPGTTCIDGRCRCKDNHATPCRDKCVLLNIDNANCGSCCHQCPAGTTCHNGVCVCRQVKGRIITFCNGTCVDEATDRNNCGACGNTCPSDQPCVNGTCACPGSTVHCGTQCVDITVDSQNCGSCGFTCPDGQSCVNGSCTCPAGFTNCCPFCLDLVNDPANCGACGNKCPAGQFCNNGVCACSGIGLSLCNGTCINLPSDPDNCGECGNVCPSGTTCIQGVCACTNPNLCNCNGKCVDESSDPNNCGKCNVVCPSGEPCVAGVCSTATCNNPFNCNSGNPQASQCGPGSPAGNNCYCFDIDGSTTSGNCDIGTVPCVDFATCMTSSDCPAGYQCAIHTCCPTPICFQVMQPQCLNTGAASVLFRRDIPARGGA